MVVEVVLNQKPKKYLRWDKYASDDRATYWPKTFLINNIVENGVELTLLLMDNFLINFRETK